MVYLGDYCAGRANGVVEREGNPEVGCAHVGNRNAERRKVRRREGVGFGNVGGRVSGGGGGIDGRLDHAAFDQMNSRVVERFRGPRLSSFQDDPDFGDRDPGIGGGDELDAFDVRGPSLGFRHHRRPRRSDVVRGLGVGGRVEGGERLIEPRHFRERGEVGGGGGHLGVRPAQEDFGGVNGGRGGSGDPLDDPVSDTDRERLP